MPIRAQVGSPDGVTNASITPDTASTTASPRAMPDRRPALRPRPPPRGAAARGRSTVQPSRRPAPAATNTAVSSSSPCGVISPKNRSRRPAAAISPADTAMLTALVATT